MKDGLRPSKATATFQVGDSVKVIDGPFKNFSGAVEEVNQDKSKVRVLVSIFGRATPVELDFVQVEPVTA
jgi:transcriptional antiterminator NusG